MINPNKKDCYRITHIRNLSLILRNGLIKKDYFNSDEEYTQIGNTQIIDIRNNKPVKISEYGMIGEYVPFYFTPRSIMLYNIVTGYRHPLVPKRSREEIMILCSEIEKLSELPQWFFTDGQANVMTTSHFNHLKDLAQIDWDCIQQGNFSKSDGDYDRPRRYQAEFLVHNVVPIGCIYSIIVYNQKAANFVIDQLNINNINLTVNITPNFFF